eukprot:982922-Heterocapsa_arctica.AAC.1
MSHVSDPFTLVSDPFTLCIDPFEHCGSSFAKNDQRFLGNLMVIARGLPCSPVPPKAPQTIVC